MRLETNIETHRFELCTVDSSFISDQYLSWLNSGDVNQYLESRFVAQTMESLSDFVEQMLLSRNSLLLAIVSKESGLHIGNIKLGPINLEHNSAPLGLVIGEKSWWGKGVAKEVISSVSDLGFDFYGLDKLNAGSYASNLGSIRAFLACGFVEEGRQNSQVKLPSGNRDDVVLLGKVRPQNAEGIRP